MGRWHSAWEGANYLVVLPADSHNARQKRRAVPTYQYTCTECDQPLEIVQSFTDDALTVCPNCGGKLRKMYNAVGIVFKGSGFYRTDSRAGSTSSDPAVPSKSSTDGPVPVAAKTDSGSGSSDSGSPAPKSTDSSSSSAKPATKPNSGSSTAA
jgi:putative FmdB family regulatory protein